MDVKPIFVWAKAHGEAKIVDRILVRLLPELLKVEMKVTENSISHMETFDVPNELYEKIRLVAEELVGEPYRVL